MLTNTRRAAFAVCGSFCTLETALAAAARLQAGGWELLPILSNTVSALTPALAARRTGAPGWRR